MEDVSVSVAEASSCSEAPAAATDATDAERPMRMPRTSENTSSLARNSIEGYMVVHRKKKKQRQRFLLSKCTHFVVANTMKHALEIYSNETRSELVYLLSLADAVLSFESDNANIVMEKCFCVDVRTWKKKNTLRLQPQGFIFFEENQTRMLLWVKCIHLAIRRATTLDSELFCSPATFPSAEPARRYSDSEESRTQTGVESSQCVASPSASPTNSSAFAATREKLTQRLVIDPATRIVTAGRTMLTPTRSSSVSGERQPIRWPNIFPHHEKQQQTRSPMSSTSTDAPSSPVEANTASPKPSSWKRFTKANTDVPSDAIPSNSTEAFSSFRSLSFRATSPSTKANQVDTNPVASPVKDDSVDKELPVPDAVKPHPPVNTNPDACAASRRESNQLDDSTEGIIEAEPAPISLLALMLVVAVAAGVSRESVFLPLALAGVLAHFCNQPQRFTSWTLTSAVVYLASTSNVVFGIGAASVLIYFWGYGTFKTRRRRRMQRRALVHYRDPRARQATVELEHFHIPNWMRYPDVDQAEWLNKVFVAGWPYLKKAIENSVNYAMKPALEKQKPAFMSSLTLAHLDLGSDAPKICGVKFVSASTLTDEVTLDVGVRIVANKKSFAADLKMVSHLGATVCLSLRELLLVGTLRVTLNPLADYWPCFGGLNLSFTDRPVLDFSLTAAKINIANVPFVSEWLHAFLHDLLLDNCLWPNVLDIQLWDKDGNPVQSEPE
ncbi:hypothetical protein PR003_g7691 [Phytophthora rubi]|uniref:SMP-LTD domain-containing protein n=1 Tax=Phytophthora rubi TaxID=129364 RepID=A0A6A3N244_9STRA|nr:hypothetical protein PR002_g7467 [Phytophthora rubi]KAE9040344.1 hypothetical protein PR001_g7097 [Phytophthora rubi]KAE9345909.1 hypothetical protein PR003_g7691 [Phytophthora rubi]